MEAQVRKESRIGKRPVPVPKGVTINITPGKVEVQGPKGKLSRSIPEIVVVKKDGDNVVIDATAAENEAARLQGLSRALVASMVKGAAEGYEKILELHGTGYRCELKGKKLVFQLGLSHPVEFDLPAEITATIPGDSKGTVLILASADAAALGQAAATIRAFRPPEPYAGKGVRFRGEQIRRKAGKAGKGGKK
ncbi:MAG TPA: 50S ribosomal protein L6 [Polyangiaceae bacterium]|nr:50S ribosomal protein L6 [Polyangiaceae bacterium]HMR73749.1 50S ribosomal protein L6 [Polyangiaceae bacterium]